MRICFVKDNRRCYLRVRYNAIRDPLKIGGMAEGACIIGVMHVPQEMETYSNIITM